MVEILTIIIITVLGMIGGQGFKWARRYLLPIISTIYIVSKDRSKKAKAFLFLCLIGILSMGYGENSWLRKLLGGSDKLTRIAYGLIVSIPFLILGKWYAAIALPIAWSVRAGGFKITNTKDFLFEDLIRYSTIGVLVVL